MALERNVFSIGDSASNLTTQENELCDIVDDNTGLSINNFHITPKKISFHGAYNGKIFHDTITIQNCGKNIGTVQIGHPTSYAFKINSMTHGERLAPGMKISRKITCVCSLQMSTSSQIPIRINDQTIFYNVEVLPSEAIIFLRPDILDFGYMNEGSKPLKQICEIYNVGTRTVPFSIEYGNQLMDLNFVPMKGEIYAKSVLRLEVIVVGSVEGLHVVEFWVKPMSVSPIRAVVRVQTIKPQLQIFHENTTGNLSLIDFQPTYYLSERHETLVIKNKSATLCTYVVLIEHNGTLMTYGEAIQNEVPHVNNFSILPQSGTLHSFQGRIVQFKFIPKKKREITGWKHQKAMGVDETADSLIFIRIVNVKDNTKGDMKAITETKSLVKDLKSTSSTASLPLLDSFTNKPQGQSEATTLFVSTNFGHLSTMAVPTNSIVDIGLDTHVLCPVSREQEKVRICLHGFAETAYISIVPDELDLGDIKMHDSVYRVVSLKNESYQLPIFYKYIKKPCIKINPGTGFLKPKEIIEVELCIKPINAGPYKHKINIQGLYFSSAKADEDLQPVGDFYFGLSYKVISPAPNKIIRFNQAITPALTNEVGMNTEVPFNGKIKKPRAATLDIKKCPKHPNSSNDNCLVAFPNDRNQSLRNANVADEVFRTIFTGQSRYKIPQIFTEADLLKKITNHSYYAKYLQTRALVRMANAKKVTNLSRVDYDIACKKVYDLMGFPSPKNCIPEQSTMKMQHFELKPRECIYIPLFPMQLYNIRVTPVILQFGVVTTKTPSMQKIFVQNFNDFRIKISLRNINDQISFPDGSDKYVEAQSKIVMSVSFTSTCYGRFSSLMNYIINDSHTFDISLFADVVKKNLQILKTFVDFSEYKPDQLYTPQSLPIEIHNPVSADIQFHWSVPEDAAYFVIPRKGVVPNRRNVICHVYRTINYSKNLETEIFLVPESGVCKAANVRNILFKPHVNFLVGFVEAKNLPLNLPQIITLQILNHSLQQAIYQVENPNPIPGVDVYPEFGVLRPRSFTALFVKFQMQATIEFKFVIMVHVQRTFLLKCKVSGNVVFPKISITPVRIKLRRISADGFDRMTFAISNESESKVEIKFPLENYPEFHLSDSIEDIVCPFQKGENLIVLYPSKDAKLFIHFHPIDVASYEFYFPMIINDIIGPVLFENPETEFTKYYLNIYEQVYRREYGLSLTNEVLPKYVPTLRISVTVAGHVLHVSKNTLTLNYSANPKVISDCQKTIKLTNVGRHDINFLIRIDNLESLPFEIEPNSKSLKYFQKIDQSLVFTDVPVHFEIILTVKFVPKHQGIFKTQLPIYIKNYDFGGVFNYISLTGNYPLPEIQCNITEIYFAAVPLNISNQRKIYLKASNYHTRNVLQYEASSQYITAEFPEGNSIKCKDVISVDIPVVVCFKSPKPISIMEHITFYDTYNNSYIIKIFATADNSVITLHEFLVAYHECYIFETNENEKGRDLAEAPVLKMVNRAVFMNSNVTKTSEDSNLDPCIDYPFFPGEESSSDIAHHLREVVEACETMIYERIYTSFFNISIPEGFHSMVSGVDTKDVCAEVGETFESSIIQMLVRLVGPAVDVFFNQRPIPTDSDRSRAHYVFRLYTQFVHFLVAQGACLSHVDPLFLLSFNDYRTYVAHVMPIQEPHLLFKYTPIFPEKIYNLLCKRQWLDVVLQLYKTTILCRVTAHSLLNHAKILNLKYFNLKPNEVTVPRTGWVLSGNDFDLINHYQSNVYNLSERILLAWLNFHYESQRGIIWKNTEDIPLAKKITNFHYDLSDSVVFICVTASYCPYIVTECFTDLYGNVTIQEMAYHNAACLISAWQRLHIGLTITPEKIVYNNPVNMVMLCTFLYTSLPHYIPATTIQFEAPLSKKTTRLIKISTPTPGNYTICFLNNEKQYFATESPKNFSANAKGYDLSLTFHAKKLRRVRVTMLLAGNMTIDLRCESLVFILEGIPEPLTPIQTIRLTGNLYDSMIRVIHIAVPYPEPAKYSIFRSENLSSSLNTFQATPWSVMKDIKVPRIIYFHSSEFEYAPNSNGLRLTLSLLKASVHNLYVIFVSPDVGDFIVRIEVLATKIKPRELIRVPIPKPWCSPNCSCSGTIKCTVNTSVPIPRKNKEMWICFKTAFNQSLKDSDREFWLARFETSIGLRMIQYIVIDESAVQEEYEHSIFKTTILYTVSCDRPDLVILPESIEITDTRGQGTITLPVKLVAPCNATITLTSKDKSEVRMYSVDFFTYESK